MTYEKLIKKIEKFNTEIITSDFLESVDKWSRYNGDKLSSENVSIENKGNFIKIIKSPKLLWDSNNLPYISKTEVIEKDEIIFDVSLIKNASRLSNFDGIVIISEHTSITRDLFVYAIRNDDNTHINFPTFEMLKEYFENEDYKPYYNLLHNFCGVYSLLPFNDNEDRIFDYTAIFSDIDMLNREFHYIAKSITVPKRKTNNIR